MRLLSSRVDRNVRQLTLGLILAVMLSSTSRAAVVPPDDLFFAPSSLVPGVYPIHPMTGDGLTTPWEATWVVGDILALDPARVDVSFTGIEVLPVLESNAAPTSFEGEYTSVEIAAIDVSNYGSYFALLPGTDIMDANTDYVADLTSSVIVFSTTAPATYSIRIKTQSRPGIGQPFENVDYMFTQFVQGDFFEEEEEREDVCVERITAFPFPTADCFVVSNPDTECMGGLYSGQAGCSTNANCPSNMRCNGGINHFLSCSVPANCPGGACEVSIGKCNVALAQAVDLLTDLGKGICRASTVAQVEACIDACHTVAGGTSKIEVAIIGHGSPGSIGFGSGPTRERIRNSGGAKTPSAFAQTVAPFTNDIHWYSCSTLAGTKGKQFSDAIGNYVATQVGYSTSVTAHGKWTFLGFKTRDGYWDICADKTSKLAMTELPALSLLALGGLVGSLAIAGTRLVARSRRSGFDVRR